jgi:pilus assembly protein Flp/PilA
MLDVYLTSLHVMRKLFRDNRGVTALEYGLIAALIAVVIIGAVSTLGGNLRDTFNGIAGHFGGGGINR